MGTGHRTGCCRLTTKVPKKPDNSPAKAVTFGSAMVDIIAVLEDNSIEQITLSNAHSQFLLVEPGRKVEAESISTHIGGGAMNAGVCFARLGCSAAPVVKVGEDASRELVIAHCEEHGLGQQHMFTSAAHPTGSSVLIASHENNAAIFTQRGANTCLDAGDLSRLDLTSVNLVHAAPLSGASAAMLPEVAELAHKAGAFFSCNPGIRQISNRTNSVLAAARHMSLISMNQVEASALAPCLSALEPNLEWRAVESGEAALDEPGGRIALAQFCEVLADHGPDNVLVTYGSQGAWLYHDGKLIHQPVIPTRVEGTAGAGDSFVSTLAWALSSGFTAEDAMQMAAHNAASVVSYVNTTDGLLDFETLVAKAGV